ncbi:MAG: hypothetical protein B6229_04635 [Spirochaetaceae bacterium 4572_7]|nr:MAG: hypothetical protein B6229_04635 [Spirochaetaceae bacterium 4572_7]
MKIMELEEFIEEMDYDYEAVDMVVSEYIKALSRQLPLLDRLFEEHEYKVLSREAHSIKGGARNLMVPGLEDVSTSLESAALHEDDIAISKYIIRLKEESVRYELFVRENLPQNSFLTRP